MDKTHSYTMHNYVHSSNKIGRYYIVHNQHIQIKLQKSDGDNCWSFTYLTLNLDINKVECVKVCQGDYLFGK